MRKLALTFACVAALLHQHGRAFLQAAFNRGDLFVGAQANAGAYADQHDSKQDRGYGDAPCIPSALGLQGRDSEDHEQQAGDGDEIDRLDFFPSKVHVHGIDEWHVLVLWRHGVGRFVRMETLGAIGMAALLAKPFSSDIEKPTTSALCLRCIREIFRCRTAGRRDVHGPGQWACRKWLRSALSVPKGVSTTVWLASQLGMDPPGEACIW